MSGHLFAEHGSRYSLRCVFCGRSSIEKGVQQIACLPERCDREGGFMGRCELPTGHEGHHRSQVEGRTFSWLEAGP